MSGGGKAELEYNPDNVARNIDSKRSRFDRRRRRRR